MTDQEKLDKATSALRRIIKEAEKGADERCKAGDATNSARLRRVVGYLNLAYAEGREIDLGGGIQPKFGDK